MASKRYIGFGLRPKPNDSLSDGYKVVLELSFHIWADFFGVVSSRMELCDIDIWDFTLVSGTWPNTSLQKS